MVPDEINPSRIRPDDLLIKRTRVQVLMGDMAVSTVYCDPDLMALRVNVTGTGEGTRAVRWIEREICELRARRIAESEARAANSRAQIEARQMQRRAKQRAGSST
jgi:hypothetical protein